MKKITHIEPTALAKHIGVLCLFWRLLYGILYGYWQNHHWRCNNNINKRTILGLFAIIEVAVHDLLLPLYITHSQKKLVAGLEST